jgi:hypothetical protein
LSIRKTLGELEELKDVSEYQALSQAGPALVALAFPREKALGKIIYPA